MFSETRSSPGSECILHAWGHNRTWRITQYWILGCSCSLDGSKYIACGYCISAGPRKAYSTDGITWIGETGCSNVNLNYIAYNGSLYLAQGIQGYLLKSTNGTSWSTITTVNNTSGSGPSISQMCYNTNTSTWLASCGNSGLYKSPDGGITWDLLLVYATFSVDGCCFSYAMGLYFIAGTGGTKYSSDLSSWTTATTNYTQQRSRPFSTGNYVIKCSEINLEYTTNGNTWTALSVLSPQCFGSVIYNYPFIQWKNAPLTLSTHSDIQISNPQDGQVLKYNASLSKWINIS